MRERSPKRARKRRTILRGGIGPALSTGKLGATCMIEVDVVGLAQHERLENFGYLGHVFGAGGRSGEIAGKRVFSDACHPEHAAVAKTRALTARTPFTSIET
jgi:hypothetical protein